MGDEEEEAALAEDEAAEDDAVAVAEEPEDEGREAIRLAAALPLTCILFYYTRV